MKHKPSFEETYMDLLKISMKSVSAGLRKTKSNDKLDISYAIHDEIAWEFNKYYNEIMGE